MRNTDSNKFVAALAIIATPFALGAFMLAWAPAGQFAAQDPKQDGYVQPRSISEAPRGRLVRSVQTGLTVFTQNCLRLN